MVTLSNRILLGLALVLAPRPGLAFFYRSRESTVAAADSILVTPETITNVVYTNEKEQQQHRDLQTLGNASFVPLSCNSPMQSPCDSFSSVGASYTTSGLLTIPCGKCVTMDITDNRTLTFTGGMRIIGQLDFPNSAVVIKTSSVIVEGELSMVSTDPITGTPKIKVILTGSAPVIFTPSTPNQMACGLQGCNVGPKAIVVAGGKLNVKGIADDCPTVAFMLSKDDEAQQTPSVFPQAFNATESCSGILIQQNFDGPDLLVRQTNFTGGMGAVESIVSGGSYDGSNFIMINNRMKHWHGVTIDANNLPPCLQPGAIILFSAKVMLKTNGTQLAHKRSRCFNSGAGCPVLKATYMTSDGKVRSRTLVVVFPSEIPDDWKWFSLKGQFTLDSTLLDPSNVYLYFSIEGPEAGIKLCADDILMKYPPASAYLNETAVCSDLAYGGDAELLPDFSFPFYAYSADGSGVVAQVVEDPTSDNNNNHVFAMPSRLQPYNGLAFRITPQCAAVGSTYRFSARLFVNRTAPADTPVVVLRRKINGTTSFESIITCPETNSTIGWVQCKGYYTFKDADSTASELQVSFAMIKDTFSPAFYDDVKFVVISGGPGRPKFNADVANCWNAGSSVVMGSPTVLVDDSLSMKIVNKTVNTDNTATLKFTGNYAASTATASDVSQEFATEFALISRNILFESEDLTNKANGATLTILNTPGVPQLLQGVLLNGFGQQGVANRFPVLFKACNSSNSFILKNAITNSNQRCIVLQATNGITVKDNVAFNTAGHCYALQEGSEVNNIFEGNFGARTKAAKLVIFGETDNYPATFLITNPNNFFSGNIAAGSEDTGFLFDLKPSVVGESARYYPVLNPSLQPLGSFIENVAHSNRAYGVRLWPSGYNPTTTASFINLKIFRNVGSGIFFHAGQNFAVNGGIFADNRIGIDIKESDNVVVNGTEIMGLTDQYQSLMERYQVASPCFLETVKLTGIRLSANAGNSSRPGTNITFVDFSRFNSNLSCTGYAISVSGDVSHQWFDTSVTLHNTTFNEDTDLKINLCDVISAGIGGVLIAESGSSPPFGSAESGIIQSTSYESFNLNCADIPGTCGFYCPNNGSIVEVTRVMVTTASQGTERVRLQIISNDSNSAVSIIGTPVVGPDIKKALWTQRRYYVIILPAGNYTASFKDENDVVVWPAFGTVKTKGSAVKTFTIQEPKTSCNQIVPNAAFSIGDALHSGWYHTNCGLQIVPGVIGNGLATLTRNSFTDGLGTFLDSRCLNDGTTFEINIDIQLMQEAGGIATCDTAPSTGHRICPRGSLIGLKNGTIACTDWGVANVGGPLVLGWNKLYGVFSVSSCMADADEVFFQIDRVRPSISIQIDNVLISKNDKLGCNAEIIENGNFDFGHYASWNWMGNIGLKMAPGAPDVTGRVTYFSLSTTNRSAWFNGPSQNLNPSCFVPGEQYVVRMSVYMAEYNGSVCDCNDVQMTQRSDACPMAYLKTNVNGVSNIYTIGTTVAGYNVTAGKWRLIYGVFKATSDFSNSTTLTFMVGAGLVGKNIIVDNVSVRRARAGDIYNFTCSNLVRNGDFAVGDARFYAVFGGDSPSGRIEMSSPGAGGVGHSAVLKNAQSYWNGIVQQLDVSCWKANEQWAVSVKLRLKERATGLWKTCDRSATFGDTMCPLPTIYAVKPSERKKLFYKITAGASLTVWDASIWNLFTGTITVQHYSSITDDKLRLCLDLHSCSESR
mmetsp:Transcript_21116/g.30168  ORF Transcript_21116/g.30168 Transcript_21116/m.30168 type:complete len:1724 (+) Transcript_21116:152-5323(+)